MLISSYLAIVAQYLLTATSWGLIITGAVLLYKHAITPLFWVESRPVVPDRIRLCRLGATFIVIGLIGQLAIDVYGLLVLFYNVGKTGFWYSYSGTLP